MQVAILVTVLFEQAELLEARKALEQAGVTIELISLQEGDHHEQADPFPVDKTVEKVSAVAGSGPATTLTAKIRPQTPFPQLFRLDRSLSARPASLSQEKTTVVSITDDGNGGGHESHGKGVLRGTRR
jgi:hypothetical protein